MIQNAVEFRDINNEVWADIAFEKRGDKVIYIRGDYYYNEQECEISREELIAARECFNHTEDGFEKVIMDGELIIGHEDGKFYYVRGDYENSWEGDELSDEQVARFVEVLDKMIGE